MSTRSRKLEKPQTLIELLRSRAELEGDRRAYTFLVDGETQELHLTYGELDLQARAIAAQLQDLAAPGERVLLLYPAGLDYVAAFFGALYAGMTAVPAYPPRPHRPMPRIRTIVADAQATVALTTRAVLAQVERQLGELPDLQALAWRATDRLAPSLADGWQDPGASAQTLAFLQYTSGSTAAPKGVMVSHGNLLHNQELIQNGCRHSERTTFVSWLPLYHDLGLIGNLIQSLYIGAPCTLMSPVSFLQRPVRWLQAISRFRAHTSGGPNFAYDLCVRKIRPEELASLDLGSWQVAFNGAEPVHAGTLARFAETFAPCGFRRRAFYPCYGMAETTLIVTGGRPGTPPVTEHFLAAELERHRAVAAPAGEGARELVGCGEPLGEMEVTIVDPERRTACRPGEVGEIWVAGPSVCGGYWGRPEATAEGFAATVAESGEGPYLRTGDLGFLRPLGGRGGDAQQGELFITGRRKELIIIRGQNHYPQDLELTVERSHPALRPGCGAAFGVEVDGAGTPAAGTPAAERLVVVQEVARQHRHELDAEAVAGAVRQALAEEHELELHALVLIRQGSLPKTTSGKIQRTGCRQKYLAGELEVMAEWREPAPDDAGEEASPAAPIGSAGELEGWLLARLGRRLGVAAGDLDRQRSVLYYGLDSLAAVELAHGIEESLGVALDLDRLLAGESIGELAGELWRRRLATPAEADARSASPLAAPAPAAEPVASSPLSHGQQALWFLHRLQPTSPAYNLAGAVRIRGPLEPAALRQAFQTLVDRHAALRTTFATADGEPVARIEPTAEVCFETVSAAGWSDAQLSRSLDRLAHQPFDLERGPLFRVTLLGDPAPEEHVLLLVAHHIVSDFWSLAVLMHELGAAYGAARDGRRLELEPPPLELTDFVRWQNELLAGPRGEELESYWRRQLAAGNGGLELPTDRPRPPAQTYRGAVTTGRVDVATTACLKALGREHDATLYATLLAGFQLLLHRLSGQPQVQVGSPTAGRAHARLAGVVGYFVNPVVLRSDLSTLGSEPSFEAFLAATRDTARAALEHQDLPFSALVERLHPVRDPSRSPLFQVMFALQTAPRLGEADLTAFALGQAGARLDLGGLEVEALALEQRIAQFDLTLSVGEVADRLELLLDYNRDLFDATTAARLARSFEVLVAAAAEHPERGIFELPLLDAGERHQLLVEWNDTAAAALDGPAVHQLFAARAAREPGRVAVVYEDAVLTYGELERRSGRLARRLRALGVGPEQVVGLYLDRSLELFVGIFGILGAGAAYVPLDPGDPPERLARIVRHAGVEVVVAREGAGSSLPPIAAGMPPDGTARDPLLARAPGRLEVVPVDGDDREDGDGLPSVAAGHAACLIYTSGSTGEPNGVVIEHRHLTRLVASFRGSYDPDGDDRMLPVTAIRSASFVGEFLPLLAVGGAVVLPDQDQLLDFSRMFELISRHGVTILSSVPAMVAGLNALKDQLPRLRLILSGGEDLEVGEVDRLLEAAEVVNGYGLTETTVCNTVHRLRAADLVSRLAVPIGRPLPGQQVHVVDRRLRPLPAGCEGEIVVGGEGVSRGYQGSPGRTARRYVPDPFAATAGARLYRTGDLGRRHADGSVEFVERIDHQVQLRGFRIELGEIESVLSRHPELRETAVTVRDDSGDRRLVAYVVPWHGDAGNGTPTTAELLDHLRQKLPAYMMPAAFVFLDSLPLLPNGKVNRAALPAPEKHRPELAAAYAAPASELERRIAEVFRQVLEVEKVGVDDNFFDLGGHSLLLARAHIRLRDELAADLSLIDLFRYSTVSALASFLASEAPGSTPRPVTGLEPREPEAGTPETEIAVIGLAGRFPGAKSPGELWQNLVAGVEGITFWSAEELVAAGVDRRFVEHPDYIRAKGILGNVDRFDAGFFGLSPRNAELMDPQHRVFLECAWEALEDAGWDAWRYGGRIGVFAGQSMNTYWLNNLYWHIDLVASVDSLEAAIGNDKDSLTTEVSYRMNLRGPSVNVQSSSSTSLTAIHYACQSLIRGECDMALSGGVSIHVPEVSGYFYHEGGTTAPDGHCRTFDADARGFVSGHGAGAVVLKRLSRALADGDTIRAVIKGSACNNDGSHKVSYMAPSVDGHAEVVAAAQAAAGVAADSIGYLEAHGTGTLLGDPIEIAALTQAWRRSSDEVGGCAIGSVKTNIGHLDTAAGVAGLIKTVLCLEHRQLPPTLHFRRPNPKIDFASSPFFVNDRLRPFERRDGAPRRAGVSSLGMGGTNTHVVLEEAPATAPGSPSRPWQLLVLSARTASALERMTSRLADWLDSPERHRELDLADVAYTLQVGRRVFDHRRILVAADRQKAAAILAGSDPERLSTGRSAAGRRAVAFLFSGQGSQYAGMGRGLYRSEPTFRREIDRGAELSRQIGGPDLLRLLYPPAGNTGAATEALRQTANTQPALYVLEHALARLWIEWGVEPQAMIGHSIGEYVAACLAGVFSFADGLRLVVTRGRLIQQLPPGAMAAVPLPAAEVEPILGAGVALAAVNHPDSCVVSGAEEAVTELLERLAADGVEGRRLHTSHAFHSPMMEPIAKPFLALVREVELRPPRIPYLSNVTGGWIRAEEATDPVYWVRHLRGTVRFADGIGELLAEPGRLFLEVGPGHALTTAVARHPERDPAQAALSSLRHPRQNDDDGAFLLTALGRLWLAGVEIDGDGFYAHERRRRVALPTYPFERQRYWVEPGKVKVPHPTSSPRPADWLYAPVWKQSPLPSRPLHSTDKPSWAAESRRWLVFLDDRGLGERMVERLKAEGQEVVTVRPGQAYCDPWPAAVIEHGAQTPLHRREDPSTSELEPDGKYRAPRADAPSWPLTTSPAGATSATPPAPVTLHCTIRPGEAADYEALLADLGEPPQRILHLWSVTGERPDLEQALERGFTSLLYLAQALGRRVSGSGDAAADPAAEGDRLEVVVVSDQLQEVTGEEPLCAAKATLLGPCRVIPRELPHIRCRSVDLPSRGAADFADQAEQVLGELACPAPATAAVAYRGTHRWVEAWEPAAVDGGVPRLRPGGVYLITGGLGGLGLALAEHLARTQKARLVLVGRSAPPAAEHWDEWLAAHGEDDGISRKIRRLRGLEELGAEVLAIAADVTDRDQMAAAVAEARERFGEIHGVVHAAGVAGGGLMLRKTPEVAAAILAPKVEGARVLDEVFADADLDFLVLYSSLTAVLAHLGQVDYAAANAFLDAFARERNVRRRSPTLAVGWDAWREVGMAASTEVPAELRRFREESLRSGLSPAEGVEVFEHALARGLPQVAVSRAPLQARLEEHVASAPEPLAEPDEVEGHARPTLATAYAPPKSDLEKRLAAVWRDLLGLEQVGIDDNFFELGGNSLIGLKVASRIKAEIGAEMSPVALFEGPTVRSLARILGGGDEPPPAQGKSRGERRRARRERRRKAAD